jgi:predicted phage-related endonuclease
MAIYPLIHDSEDWHSLRQKNVGGSEVGALFGCAPDYSLSHYALWMVKSGRVPAPEVNTQRAKWGLRLEDAIANARAEEVGWGIRKGGYITDDTTPGLGCTLDYIIDSDPDEDGPGCMEVKNVDWMIHRRSWINEEPPLHIILQHQHQLAATGYAWGEITALVGGNDLKPYRYKANPKVIKGIRQKVTEFWESIAAGESPDPDGSDGSFHALRHLYPEILDEAIDLSSDNELPVLCADALRLQAERLAADKEEKAIKARIMEKLGEHARAQCVGFYVNISVTPEHPGRLPKPYEIIGARKEVRKLNIKESAFA